jgi:hypothetical protein
MHLSSKNNYNFFLSMTSSLTVGAEDYCCTWSQSRTHTNTHPVWLLFFNPTHRPLTGSTQDSQGTDSHAPCGIRTRNPKKREATDLRPYGTATGIGLQVLNNVINYIITERERERKSLFVITKHSFHIRRIFVFKLHIFSCEAQSFLFAFLHYFLFFLVDPSYTS